MKKISIITLLLLFLSVDFAIAQEDSEKEKTPQLLTPSFSFSRKKTSYVTLKNGKELKGTLSSLKRKKGLITSIKFADEQGERKIEAKEIAHMYLPPSGYDKLSKRANFFGDIKNWTSEKVDNDLVNNGYVYFESVDVIVKKKTIPMLMQLLNPNFCKAVSVYDDPYAKKTAAVGVGGLTLAGGYAKSYYIKKANDKSAFKLLKGKYKKEYPLFWKGCSVMTDVDAKDVSWYNLVRDIIKYTSECK